MSFILSFSMSYCHHYFQHWYPQTHKRTNNIRTYQSALQTNIVYHLFILKAFNIERSGQCEQYESQHNKSERSTESLLEYHSTPWKVCLAFIDYCNWQQKSTHQDTICPAINLQEAAWIQFSSHFTFYICFGHTVSVQYLISNGGH